MVRLLFIIAIIAGFSNANCQQDSIQEMGYPFEDVPEFKGDLRQFVKRNIVYPESAVLDSIEGKVYVKYLVDTSGKTKNHTVVKGIREDLNKEAIRVAKMIKYDSPAKIRGKPVLFYFTLPIRFKLPQQNKLLKKECKHH